MDKCRTSGDCDRRLAVTTKNGSDLHCMKLKSLWTSNQPREKSALVIEVILRGRGMCQC